MPWAGRRMLAHILRGRLSERHGSKGMMVRPRKMDQICRKRTLEAVAHVAAVVSSVCPYPVRLALQLPLHVSRPPLVSHVPLPLPSGSRLPLIGALFDPLVIVACTPPLPETPPSMATSGSGIAASPFLICTW